MSEALIKRMGRVEEIKGVKTMEFDHRLLGGILVGLVVGLNYHTMLITYLPIFTIAALIVGLQLVRR